MSNWKRLLREVDLSCGPLITTTKPSKTATKCSSTTAKAFIAYGGHLSWVQFLQQITVKIGGSPGLVVMEGDSRSKGCGFKSRHCILDGHFFTYICCKNCHVRLKRPKLTKKRPGLALFKKKNQIKFYLVFGTELQFSNLMSLLI